MVFAGLLKDTVSVLKQNGERYDGVQANVQGGGIYIMRSDILIEPMDIVQRNMSNGGVETFEVIDPCFYEAHTGIPAHYQMKVKKLGVPEAQKQIQSITYNLSGANARINQNSVDQSINYLHYENADVLKCIQELKTASGAVPENERGEYLEVVDEIESSVKSGGKFSVIKALVSSLPNLGNISTIGSFLLQCLSRG